MWSSNFISSDRKPPHQPVKFNQPFNALTYAARRSLVPICHSHPSTLISRLQFSTYDFQVIVITPFSMIYRGIWLWKALHLLYTLWLCAFLPDHFLVAVRRAHFCVSSIRCAVKSKKKSEAHHLLVFHVHLSLHTLCLVTLLFADRASSLTPPRTHISLQHLPQNFCMELFVFVSKSMTLFCIPR